MAVLSDNVRLKLWRGMMRYWSAEWEPIIVSAGQLLDAVNATDDWVDANSAALNAALPAAFRTTAGVEQKAFLLAMVALARRDPDLVRSILGGTD